MLPCRLLKRALTGLLLLTTLPAFAQDRFVLVTSPAKVDEVCGRHGLTQLSGKTGPGVFLVSTFSADPTIATDSDVQSFEGNQRIAVPELSGATTASLTQSTSAILGQLPGRAPVNYYGNTVANYFVTQPATSIARLNDAQNSSKLTGSGIVVAIIDTGVDPQHQALKGALIDGYDFVHNISGGSEMRDISSGSAAGLTQSTSAILGGQELFILNSSTAAILSQNQGNALNHPPSAFGHGTMTAGLVHLIAPGARIMPLKAFSADGSSDLFNIIRAIYYAVDHGANVISMSFEISSPSVALQNAIQYALGKNVVLVAASGNDGQQVLVYPAAYNSVVGVGSTDGLDIKSNFTNYGTNAVFIAAPGEGVITTYPGSNYAAGWGTSFSTPMVAGEAALVLQGRPGYHPGDVANAISRAAPVPQMGHGRMDLCLGLSSIGIGVSCPK